MANSLTVAKWEALDPSENNFRTLLWEAATQLNTRGDRDFLVGLREKYDHHRGAMFITPNQLNKLKTIAYGDEEE